MRGRTSRGWIWFAAAIAVVALAAGCGGSSGSSSSGGGGGGGGGNPDATIIMGTTDTAIHFDPANAYDLHSWNIIYNVYDTLLRIPPGGNKPVPSLATSCTWDDAKTYTCHLRSGVKFQNGDPLTSKDVEFSIQRSIVINGDQGACYLFASLATCGKWKGDEISTPDPQTVTFHLTQPDATWPFILATGAAAIVPSGVYPADKLQPDTEPIGSGPYKLVKYQPGVQTVLERNDNYWGEKAKNARVLIQYYKDTPALKLAVQGGDVDIAFRNLTPTDISSLRGQSGLKVVEGQGIEIRYLVFNVKLPPSNQLAVRRSIAYLIDRQSIAHNVYNDTVQPLYSMIPVGLFGHTDAYKDRVRRDAEPDPGQEGADRRRHHRRRCRSPSGGRRPTTAAARPTSTRRSSVQLEGSGLFKVTLKSEEWDQYAVDAARTSSRPSSSAGSRTIRTPTTTPPTSIPTADSGTATTTTRRSTRRSSRRRARPTSRPCGRLRSRRSRSWPRRTLRPIPIWQGKQIAVVRNGVTGVEQTFDPAYIFRFWLICEELGIESQ